MHPGDRGPASVQPAFSARRIHLKRMVRFVLPIALVFAAAGCEHVDSLGIDDSQRIEDAMRPPPPDEPLPEGIALGEDAPPLAPEWPEPPWGRAYAWPGAWGFFGPGCFHGPGCMHRQPPPQKGPGPGLAPPPQPVPPSQPGGSTPGLLP